jgi:hypothetical protein
MNKERKDVVSIVKHLIKIFSYLYFSIFLCLVGFLKLQFTVGLHKVADWKQNALVYLEQQATPLSLQYIS